MEAKPNLVEIATLAATTGAAYLRGRWGDAGAIDHKGAIDLVTEADRGAEATIIDVLGQHAPEHAILTEERGVLGRPGAAVRWIIDPLDGTTNFAHTFAMFAVSVAAELRGEVVTGAVAVPLLDELFVAERGAGAQLTYAGATQPLQVSKVGELDRAFLATGFPYDIRTNPDNNLDHFQHFATRCLAVRRAGAAALDLAYMAAGRFDGFWELRLQPWDWAAGWLLIEEAGGTVTQLDGSPMRLDAPGVCASNGQLHGEMLEVLKLGGR